MAELGLTAEAVAERSVGGGDTRLAGPSGGLSWLSAPQAASIIADWRNLATRSAEANVFFHPGILLPAIDHLDQGVAIATVRDLSGKLIALTPVTRSRLGMIAPAVRVWAHDDDPLGVPLLDRDAIDDAAAAIVAAAGAVSLVVPSLHAEGPVASALHRAADRAERPAAMLDTEVRAMLDRSGVAGTIRASLATRRREEFARQMRRLADLGAVTVETAVEPDRVRARCEEFLTLESAGWKGEKGTALACHAATAAFTRDIVFNRSERGTVRVVSIRLGDHPVAIVVCFVAGSTAYTWKIAYDEVFSRFSPGAQLMLETADSLFGDPAIERIDSCASANHPMIDHLWPGRLTTGTLVIGPVGGGLVYRAGLAAFAAEIEARGTARTLRAQFKLRHRKTETEQ